MSQSLLAQAGAQPQKQPKFVPLFIDRAFTGLYTQRSVLHDPSDLSTSRFYGGRPDALWQGSNVELTNRLTLQRRPGLSAFSTATYPTPPDRSFAFQLLNGTIQVIIDTESTGSLTVTSVDTESAGDTIYNGTFPGGGSNSYAGLKMTFAGFTNGGNNGTFTVISSTTTTITVANPNGIAETAAATAVSSGGIYWDQQNGSKTLIFAKGAGAGQAYFVAVAGVLYFGDGVETGIYTPGGANGSVWGWGTATPGAAPTYVITEAASASVVWEANTWFTTMGLLKDSNGNIQQLYTVNANSLNPNTQFGTSSNGQPAWNQSPGGTTSDGTVTWTNQGAIGVWMPTTVYQSGAVICVVIGGIPYLFISTHNYPVTTNASAPAWNTALLSTGARTNESNGARWGCLGQINATPSMVESWSASTAFNTYVQPSTGSNSTQNNNCVVEPTLILPPPAGQTVYLQAATTAGTTGSGSTPPSWATTPGQTTNDGELGWIMVSTGSWSATTAYSAWTPGIKTFSVVVDQNNNFQVCTTTGTSTTVKPSTSSVLSAASNASGGNTTYTGTFATPYPAGYSAVIAGFTNSVNNGTFKIVSCNSTTLVVANPSGTFESHAGTAVFNPWGTNYGSTTSDGTAVWTCVGTATTWNPNAQWYLPANGFAPPSASQPYGGASIIDSNGDEEFVINSGESGVSAPSWGAVGTDTTDNGVTWYNLGTAITTYLTWQFGFAYAYSFYSRTTTDQYSPLPAGGGLTPPGLSTPLGAPTGSETGAISTASPVATITGSNTGAIITLTGQGTTDPAYDTIIIWRSADGGGSSNMFFLTEIPNPPPVGGVAGTWTFVDFLPSVATALYPGLDNLLPAPIDDENDLPPSNFLPMTYNFNRIWGASGQEVIWSGGPDVITGNPNFAFNPSDDFEYLANVIRIVKVSTGQVVFLTDSIEFIAGGPLTSSFYTVTLGPGIGLNSFNALDVYAGEIYFVSSDSQFRVINPSLNISNAGFPIGDQIANLNASNVYVAVQQQGVDNAIFVADGSTGWWRCNPHQVPGGASGPEPIWSPFANITNGCQMVQSVEVTPGIKKLLVGPTTANSQILERNLSVYTDNGTAYDAYFVMGSIVLAHPGQLAVLKFIEFDFSGSSYQPTVSYLLNEIAATGTAVFVPMSTTPTFDPPSLYNPPPAYGTLVPQSYSPNRYYFSSTGSLSRCRHLQVKVDFGTTSNGDELFDLTIFGRIFVEF